MKLLTIAKKNIKKNSSFYFLYLFSVSFVLMVFFSFISFSMDEVIIESISSDGRVEAMSKVVGILIMAFVLFYMSYSNTFFMKRRMKELGIYALLGYRKSTMIRLLSWENFLICTSALGIGIILGAFLHKFIVIVIVHALGLQIDTMKIPLINFNAVLLSFIFVLAVLFILLLSNCSRCSNLYPFSFAQRQLLLESNINTESSISEATVESIASRIRKGR